MQPVHKVELVHVRQFDISILHASQDATLEANIKLVLHVWQLTELAQTAQLGIKLAHVLQLEPSTAKIQLKELHRIHTVVDMQNAQLRRALEQGKQVPVVVS
jgi:hypothetical protein